jgi:type I restriction enzyme S subunit
MNASHILLDEIIVSDESGFACSKTKLVDNGLIHLRPFNLTDDGALSFKDLYRVPIDEAPKNKRKLEEGDILFNNTNSVELVGKAALVQQSIEAGFSNHLTRIRIDKTKVIPQWVSYWLRWKRGTGHFSAHATQWVSQAAFKSSELRRMAIPYLPLGEQLRLVDILTRAESIVRLRREALKKTQEIVPALFLDMFGDPVVNPKRWPTAKLATLASFLSGGTPTKKRDDYWTGPIPWVSPKDMKVSEIHDSIDHVSMSVLSETNIKLVPIGAVLIVVRGMILVHTVPVAQVMVPLVINQDMKALIPRSSLNGAYLSWTLKVCQKHLLNMVDTAAHGTKKLETERLGEFVIPAPPIQAQADFATRLNQIHSIQSQATRALATAEATFQSLLHRAFAGEL